MAKKKETGKTMNLDPSNDPKRKAANVEPIPKEGLKAMINLLNEMIRNTAAGVFEPDTDYVPETPNYDEEAPSLCDDSKPRQLYILRVSLKKSPIKIYRKIQVPSNLRLGHLASIILDAMGWWGDHMHQFHRHGHYYTDAEQIEHLVETAFAGIDYELHDSFNYTVADLLPEKGQVATFEYDFGCSWEHEVKLSTVKETASDVPIVVLKGEGACPPEDSGGVWCYDQMLTKPDENGRRQLKKNYKHYELKDFDPYYFDLEEAQKYVDGYVEDVLAGAQGD